VDKGHLSTILVDYLIRPAVINVTSLYPATPGQDFVAKSGTLSFAPNILEASFDLELVADGIWEEHDEDVDIVLSNARGEPCDIADGTAYVRIADPGDAGVLVFEENTYDWGRGYEFLEGLENGQQNIAEITVTRLGGTSGRITVDYEDVSRDSGKKNYATAGADYTPMKTRSTDLDLTVPGPNTLVFEDGESRKTFTITLRQDTTFE
jgi:hypothetical protein